ncbi:MAG TPA: cell division protein FtsK [Candidatus Moranbacteria bacterium]|nr:cell division protein FtsK [Candidatus Moranbacteria bacterium]HAT75086.1 cell division protein FtsK [Candidatus Moranbacteria bacterium]
MGRKKTLSKEKKENNIAGEKENKFNFNLSSDVKRNIAGVVLFTLAILTGFGFFGYSGMAGKSLNNLSAQAVGWAKFILPLFLIIAGAVLLFKKETLFYVTKLVGLAVIFVSMTGFFHWFFKASEMREMAAQGKGGGYVGYAAAYFLAKYLGNAGSLVVILALFLLGIIVAFEFSIVNFLRKFKKEKKQDEEKAIEINLEQKDKQENISAEAIDNIEDDNKNQAGKKLEDEAIGENIGKIKFVEGRDQFVDSDLEEMEIGGVFSQKKIGNKIPLSAKKRCGEKWKFPPVDILEKASGIAKSGDTEMNAEIIKKTLDNFGILVERGEIKVGPSVTQYSFRPAVGVKIAKILALQNDLSLALANPIRIEAPIPGKSLFGIEVPNRSSSFVRLRTILESREFKNRKSNLSLALGENVSGNYIFGSLDKMPHLMIAGATGTGKSVCINSIIAMLLYQNSPEDLKFIMIDPKRVELSLYNGIPHLLTDVIVENAKVINTLKWAVSEMEKRYKLFQEIGVRDIISYKEKLKNGEKRKLVDAETGEVSEEDLKTVPYIIIIVDELADLMGSHGREVEGAIVRIAQMARAVGIHLIISTQRPSVEVITGLIKANITTRIAFQVATQIDSRTILDMAGAEKLLGNGDMLYLSASSSKPQRVQGVFATEKEAKEIVKFIKEENPQNIIDEEDMQESALNNPAAVAQELDKFNSFDDSQNDELYETAKKEILQSKKASASFLQRRLRVGYARAARLLDILEEKGIVGPADGAKPREIFGLPEQEQTVYDDNVDDQEKRDKWEM